MECAAPVRMQRFHQIEGFAQGRFLPFHSPVGSSATGSLSAPRKSVCFLMEFRRAASSGDRNGGNHDVYGLLERAKNQSRRRNIRKASRYLKESPPQIRATVPN